LANLTWGGAVLCGAALLVPRTVTATPQQPESITFTVVVSGSAPRGEPVPITLRLTNAGDRTLTLYLTGRSITFDIIVARPDGDVVWRRLEHVATQQILQVKTLAPGETLELQDRWRQRTNAGSSVPPGDYTVTGVIPTDGQPLRTAPVRLRITP
jgi:hypothetical protein